MRASIGERTAVAFRIDTDQNVLAGRKAAIKASFFQLIILDDSHPLLFFWELRDGQLNTIRNLYRSNNLCELTLVVSAVWAIEILGFAKVAVNKDC